MSKYLFLYITGVETILKSVLISIWKYIDI